MTPTAQQALNSLEDAERDCPLPNRTLDEAVAYAIENGYLWGVFQSRYYRIVDGRAVFTEPQVAEPGPACHLLTGLETILLALGDEDGNLPDNGEYSGAALAEGGAA